MIKGTREPSDCARAMGSDKISRAGCAPSASAAARYAPPSTVAHSGRTSSGARLPPLFPKVWTLSPARRTASILSLLRLRINSLIETFSGRAAQVTASATSWSPFATISAASDIVWLALIARIRRPVQRFPNEKAAPRPIVSGKNAETGRPAAVAEILNAALCAKVNEAGTSQTAAPSGPSELRSIERRTSGKTSMTERPDLPTIFSFSACKRGDPRASPRHINASVSWMEKGTVTWTNSPSRLRQALRTPQPISIANGLGVPSDFPNSQPGKSSAQSAFPRASKESNRTSTRPLPWDCTSPRAVKATSPPANANKTSTAAPVRCDLADGNEAPERVSGWKFARNDSTSCWRSRTRMRARGVKPRVYSSDSS